MISTMLDNVDAGKDPHPAQAEDGAAPRVAPPRAITAGTSRTRAAPRVLTTWMTPKTRERSW